MAKNSKQSDSKEDTRFVKNIPQQLALAESLLDFGMESPSQKDLHSITFPRDAVVTVIGLFTKANITYRAIIVLCEQGLERPATALSRSLFETLLNLTFLVRKQVSLRIFNDSKSKPTSLWPLHGKTLTAEFRLALFNAWSILRDEKAIEGWSRTPGLKRHGLRASKKIAPLDRSYANVIGPEWEKVIKSKNTCVGMDIASFAASLGPVFRKWHRSVYAGDSAFIHQSDTSSYLAVTTDGNFTPRIYTSAKEVSGALLRASTLYLGCVEELNKRFQFGESAKKSIKNFGKRLRKW
jgi:hypothetical protein